MPAPTSIARPLPFAVLLALVASGCAAQLDLASDTQRPTTTIRYTSVRGEARTFADYGSIDRSILAAPP